MNEFLNSLTFRVLQGLGLKHQNTGANFFLTLFLFNGSWTKERALAENMP
jgi:hypothetical protein